MNSITNIVIDYENEDEVIEYARELEKQSYPVFLVVVVNKEGEKGLDFLERELNRTGIQYEILNPKSNLGYLNGLIYGYKNTRNKSDWVVFSNTDILIPDNNFFLKFLQSSAANDQNYWVIGPSVYSRNKNEYSNPYFINRPTKRHYQIRVLTMNFPHFFNFVHKTKNKFNSKKADRKKDSGEIYAVHGAFMMLRRELADELSKRTPWEILFSEEQYISEVVLTNGKKVYFDSSIEVVHIEQTSTGKIDLPKTYKLLLKANTRLLKEFY